ncbi:hypothetical protein ACTWQC_24200, partial [Streptomyces sp. 8N616]
EDVPKNLRKLKKSYDLAGDALAAYWPELEKAQDDSKRALEKGREARRDLSTANTRLESANDWVDRAGKKAEEFEDSGKKKDVPPPDEKEVRAATRNHTQAQESQRDAQTAVDNAQSALDAAKKMAADAKKLREDAATKAEKKLEEASDAGTENRSWWEEAVDWVSDNWDTIVAVCKVVVAIVGIIAMIIGGPILAAIVVVAALVVLADTINKYLKGQATLLDVAFAALDCIPGMKGITSLAKLNELRKAGGMLKIGSHALTSLRSGMANMASLVRAGGRGTRTILQTGGELRRVRGDADFFSDWADEAYDMIRASDDVDSVAATAAEHGFSRTDISQIKSHLFEEEHLLDSYGEAYRGRFDANPRIAEAWMRLRDGNPHSADIDLLRHELHESNHMRSTGNPSYREAHQATNDAGRTWDPEAAARDGFGRRI